MKNLFIKLTFALSIFLGYACNNQIQEKSLSDDEIQLLISNDVLYYQFLSLGNNILDRCEEIKNDGEIDMETATEMVKKETIFLQLEKLIDVLESKYPNFEFNGLEVINKGMLNLDLVEAVDQSENNRSRVSIMAPCNPNCIGAPATAVKNCFSGCSYSAIWCMQNGGSFCNEMNQACNGDCCDSRCPE